MNSYEVDCIACAYSGFFTDEERLYAAVEEHEKKPGHKCNFKELDTTTPTAA